MKQLFQRYAWWAGIVGLWVLLTPFLGLGHVAILISNLTAGFLALMVGFSINSIQPWQGWTLGLLGFWLYLAAFLFELHTGPDVWVNNITVGALIAIAGFATRRGVGVPRGESLRAR